ncbi:MAG: hypothetical protein AAF458_20705 [Pseudomonadota bacterium]
MRRGYLDRLGQSLLIAGVTLAGNAAVAAFEVSGFVAAEARGFAHAPLDARQRHHSGSLVVQPEFYTEWADGEQSLLFVPFMRLDSADSERTHADVRELIWQYVGDGYEFKAGIGKVFWGVTESQHLVDIINQTDAVESPDGEDKLGQPMLSFSTEQDWGTVDLFVLPGFRERTFSGAKGRLRTTPRVDTDRESYESGAGRRHVDLAFRYSHFIDSFDFAVSHFYGTSREPTLTAARTNSGEVVLAPFYPLIHQTGLELQYTDESWLWKLETIRRTGQGSTYYAYTGGFEYTFYGVVQSQADLGVIGELLYDERGESGPAVFQKDVLVGLRLALNDEESTELLAGVITDLDDGSHLFSVEASRRLSDNLKLSVEGRVFADLPTGAPFYTVRRDDYLQLELAWFF